MVPPKTSPFLFERGGDHSYQKQLDRWLNCQANERTKIQATMKEIPD